MKKEMMKPFTWGVAVGAIVLLIVVFATGLAVTKSSANEQAENMVAEAVTDKLATICVAQFQQDPEKDQMLKELKAVDNWKRDEYIQEQDFAKIAGIKELSSRVYNECAERILEASK